MNSTNSATSREQAAQGGRIGGWLSRLFHHWPGRLAALAVLAACLSDGLARADTLFFENLVDNGSWEAISNWFEPDSMGDLQPVYRTPNTGDSVVLTPGAFAFAFRNNITVDTLILEPGSGLFGGDFQVTTFETAGTAEITNAAIEITDMWEVETNGGGSTMLVDCEIIIDAGAYLTIEAGSVAGYTTLGLTDVDLWNDGEIFLNDSTQIGFSGPTNYFTIEPGATLHSTGAALVGNSGTGLVFDDNGLVSCDTGTLTLALTGPGVVTLFTNSMGPATYAASDPAAIISFFGFSVSPGGTNIFIGPGTNWFTIGGMGTNSGLMQIGSAQTPGTVLFEATLGGGGLVHVLGGPGPPSTLIWDNGMFAGPIIQIDTNGQFEIENAPMNAGFLEGLVLAGSTVSNSGTTTLESDITLTMESGAVFNNEPGGLFVAANDADPGNPPSVGMMGPAFFNNTGTVRVDAGSNEIAILADFINSGLLDVQSGTLLLGPGTNSSQINIAPGAELSFGTGTNVLAAGTSLSGGGPIAVGTIATGYAPTDLWLATNVSISNIDVVLTVDGPGTLTVSGTLTAGIGATLQGTGALDLAPSASLIADATGLDLLRNVNNSGTAVFEGGAVCIAEKSVTWNNEPGSSLLLNNSSFDVISLGGGPPPTAVLINAGTLIATNSASTIWALTNSGSVVIGNEALNLGTLYVQTAGSTVLGSAGEPPTAGDLTTPPTAGAPYGSGLILIEGGTISGSGVLGGTVANSGTIMPGDGPGVISVSGNFTNNPGGALTIEIGGLTSGTQYSQLTNPGPAAVSLAGTLNVQLVNGFAPALGNTFTVMSFPAWQQNNPDLGRFTFLTGLHFGNGLVLAPVYAPNGLNLVTAAEPTPTDFSRSGAGGWSFSFQTTAGLTNIVQYTDSLSPPNWQTLTAIVGDGAVHVVHDAVVGLASRFYRVGFE
jgi:hypothetical protein